MQTIAVFSDTNHRTSGTVVDDDRCCDAGRMMNDNAQTSDITDYASEIVSAYVAKNHVSMSEMPALIRSVYDTLSTLGQPAAVEAPAAPLTPAVPIKKSVTDEYIISLEDGRKFKSLKRYLATSHNMTPAEYRTKWGLPSDYPMVAPAYAAKRSALAKTIGLGRKAAEVPSSTPEPEAAPSSQPEVAATSPKRGRKKTG